MTAHRHRFLFARSRSGNDPEGLVQGHFDLALFAPSWDNRSVSITGAKSISIDTSVVLKFATKDEYGIQDGHEATLDGFLKERSSSSISIQGDALDLPGLWSQLWEKLSRVADTFDHPLRVLIDLSTCPRYYSLGAIAGILRHGIASSVNVFYAEGVYKDPFGGYAADFPFTTGKWLATAIPFLRGTPDPLKGKSFIVSVGFEGIKTARVLAREDPDSVALLFPDPGVLPEYVKQTRERNGEIIEQYRIASDHIYKAPAGDAIAAWKTVCQVDLESVIDNSVYYLCCGTKPHSLAMALRAVTMEDSTVLYNLPGQHSFVRTDPNGVYWAYEIVDVTTPYGSPLDMTEPPVHLRIS